MIKVVLMLLLMTVISAARTRKHRIKTELPHGMKLGGKLPTQMKIGTGKAALAVGATAALIGAPIWAINKVLKKSQSSGSSNDLVSDQQSSGSSDDQQSTPNDGCTTDIYDSNTGTTYYCEASSGRYYYYDQSTGESHWYSG